WKLYPVILRWLSGAATAASTPGETGWQTLPEPADLVEQAGRALREGMYAGALRLALPAPVAPLGRPRLRWYDTSGTNRECQRELRQVPEVATCFGQVARIYERVWYGRVAADRAEAERAIGLCESLINREELAPE